MKNQVLEFIESKGYTLRELRGAPVPVFWLEKEDIFEFVIINRNQYQPSRQPTAEESEIVALLLHEMQRYQDIYGEFKFISYDFSLDNSQ